MSGEWEIPLWTPDEAEWDEEPTVVEEMGAIPEREIKGDITAECVSLRDILLRAKDISHENDLVDFMVLSRFK